MSRLLKKYTIMSLRQKLILSSIICLLVPLMITVAVSNYMAKDVLKDNAISNSQETMKMVELNISGLMNNLLYITNYIQFDSEMNSLIKEGKEIQSESEQALNQAKITAKLNSITNLLSDLYITILVGDQNSYTNYSFYNYNYKLFYQEPWFSNLKSLNAYETYWLGSQPNYILSTQKSNPYLMTIARTIQYSSEPFGYVIISAKEKEFHESFQKLSGNQDIMMVNSNGKILSHKDPDKIGGKFPYADNISLSRDDARLIKIDGVEYLVASHKLSFSDWSLVSLTQYKEATEKINFIQRANLLIQVLFYSLFLVILIFLVRQITKPLGHLGRVAAEIESGNLSVRSGIQGNNEIGKVGRSFDKMLNRIEEMIKQTVMEQAKKRKIELEMLQAQINPHFLFNILNSIRLKILMKDDQENASLIQALSSLLRMTINRKNEFIPLYQEVNIVTSYIELMNMRQEDPIQYEVALQEEALLQEVPRFFIQPFIENAYTHGFHEGGGRIIISVNSDHLFLVVTVEDNGKGMTAEQRQALIDRLETDSDETEERMSGLSGIGVKNVYERMKLIYGQSFQLKVDSTPDKGTKITLFIPTRSGGGQ
ncbi:HAMP domain-containing protein [Paenibacillus sp. LMG 31456]|uniref:HAMP domain-containing protein n=1 Tax=Paenibacillus foliorum TaxID=2654974 RepID=A0A972GZQ7_9BACL|nr:histidine kinase [Paenibacillus foliorum]NOU95880.1 HAMP domain-containing protein [Paenibacillus foliorum]